MLPDAWYQEVLNAIPSNLSKKLPFTSLAKAKTENISQKMGRFFPGKPTFKPPVMKLLSILIAAS